MSRESESTNGTFPTVIEGRTFLICTERLYKEASLELSGEWHAWSFFAYDQELNIYPHDEIPAGVDVQESIAGETGNSLKAAREAVEAKLRGVLKSKTLDGTGFYSPPVDFIYPQGLPKRK